MFPRTTEEMQTPIANYKAANRAKAESKNLLIELMSAKTLTQCKKVMNGLSRKQTNKENRK